MHEGNYKVLTMYNKLFFSNNYFSMQEYIGVLCNYTVNTTDSKSLKTAPSTDRESGSLMS